MTKPILALAGALALVAVAGCSSGTNSAATPAQTYGPASYGPTTTPPNTYSPSSAQPTDNSGTGTNGQPRNPGSAGGGGD
jgi:hypothetical protein